jgi:hypothetical protein
MGRGLVVNAFLRLYMMFLLPPPVFTEEVLGVEVRHHIQRPPYMLTLHRTSTGSPWNSTHLLFYAKGSTIPYVVVYLQQILHRATRSATRTTGSSFLEQIHTNFNNYVCH